MGLAHGYFVALDIQVVLADVVDLGDVDDVRPVHFDKVLPVHFFFEVLDGIVRDVLLVGRNKFYIIAHAFDEQDIVVVQSHQFAIAFDKNVIGSRAADIVIASALREFVQGFLEALEGEGFFEKVRYVVLKCVVRIF